MNTTELDVRHWTTAPLRFEVNAALGTDAATAFHTVSDPQAMCALFRGMDSMSLVAPGGLRTTVDEIAVGTIRICVTANGLLLEEEIVHWQPPLGYAYRGVEATHPFGMQGHVATVGLTPTASGCRLDWRHYFDHANVAAMHSRLSMMMTDAVDDLVRRFGGRQLQQKQQNPKLQDKFEQGA